MYWRKSYTGMVPDCTEAQAWFEKTKMGQTVEMKGNRPRNAQFHKKFFGMLKLVVENTDFTSELELLYAVKAALHLGKWVEVEGFNTPLFIADSINFSSMPQEDFEKLYSDAKGVIMKNWLPCDNEDLEREILGW